ncbi:hypothetical protein [Pseudomonas sp. 2FE]|uniref:hypothetical protein n=1 Tax=Pseudomonas sp. 2FE TaxID=2502190 RepID=UPI0010F4790E|nr:hypothetical protein [Pseudomonas sp. 2FE]
MPRNSLFRLLFALTIGLLAGFTPAAFATPLTPQEQMQVYSCRATSSLLLYRGEGFQASYAQRVDNDLAALAAALQSSQPVSEELRKTHQELVTQIRRGVSFGPNEEDVPWSYQKELSKALRDFLLTTHGLASNSAQDELPVKVEYLSVQYLFRSYIGSFELARENSEQYLGQDERVLVPDIDTRLVALNDQDNPAIGKIKTRWSYLKVALNDMNSQSSALASASGRPFAPTTVDRHTRTLTEQLMSLN